MTIELTIRLPDKLHQRLETRAKEKDQTLDQVLLEELEKVLETEAEPAIEQERVLEALYSTGLIQPISTELVQRYVSDPDSPRQKPLKILGKPLSEVIIEQRGARRRESQLASVVEERNARRDQCLLLGSP